jgi:hypothetical protein
VVPTVFAPAQHHAAMQLAARATAARRATAPGDLIHIPFDQRRAGQGHGQELFQTPPKLEDVTPEAAEFFSGPFILHSLILYYIQKRGSQDQKSQAQEKMLEEGLRNLPAPAGFPGVPS